MEPPARQRDFDKVGGLNEHIRALKEMIIYPLLYRELFEAHGMKAPRGVLFHGPPGTGKTLVAGAIAAECNKSSNRRVSFYMQKGAECLNKYYGESEKNLRNLFTQAQNNCPSIIFFDEIDGLVPTRSDTHGRTHASVVGTLLALMDGLDSKSEVFVIGATNRIDIIDPALRRPGRFDQELYFPLPPLESRVQIFKIHTRNWEQKPSANLLLKLAAECAGYCGADIHYLCAQAVMKSFCRNFPQVNDTSRKHQINYRSVEVTDEDFWAAKEKVVPASQRMYVLPSRPLPTELEPLLRRSLDACLDQISRSCPFRFMYNDQPELSEDKNLTCPRFLLMGKEGQGHVSHIAPAILQQFDHLPVTIIDLPALEKNVRFSKSSRLIQKIEKARQNMPGILYLADITKWWDLINDTSKLVLVSCIEDLDSSNNSQIFILGSVNNNRYDALPSAVKSIFPKKKTFTVFEPENKELSNFFAQVLIKKNTTPPKLPLDFPDHRSNIRKSNQHVPHNSIMKVRSGRKRGAVFDCEYTPNAKKLKASSWQALPSCSKGMINVPRKKDELKVDVTKLERLVDKAVAAVANCSISAIIKLYEELKIVSLRFATMSDRSSLPQELEREISIFNPT